MAKFKVIMGTHIEGGKAYTKGQIVNSPKELARMFPGKFLAMAAPDPEEDPVPPPAAKTTPPPAPVPAVKPAVRTRRVR